MWGIGKKKTPTIKMKTKIYHQILSQASGKSSGKWVGYNHTWTTRKQSWLWRMCFNSHARSCRSYKAEIEHTSMQSHRNWGKYVRSDIAMNRSDTVPPLCTAVGCRDREWGPVNPRAGRHRGWKERQRTWVPAYVTHQQREHGDNQGWALITDIRTV